MAAGRLAVAAPDRVLSRPARAGGGEGDVPGLHRLPGEAALAGGGGLAGGGAGQGADELGAADPGGVLLIDQLRGFGAEDRPGGRPGAGDGGLGFLQRGLEPGPPPGISARELGGGVGGVVVQVGDQAEHLRDVLAGDGHVVFDDADLQAPPAASAGQVAVVAAVGQEAADPGQGDVAFDADQHVGAGGQHPGHPVSSGKIPVEDPDPAAGEYFRVPGDHGVQQRLLALGLGAAGRAGDHRQRGAGGRGRRPAGHGPAGRARSHQRCRPAERPPVGRRVGDAGDGPVDRATRRSSPTRTAR